jgi:ribose transport system substrate-binding protein
MAACRTFVFACILALVAPLGACTVPQNPGGGPSPAALASSPAASSSSGQTGQRSYTIGVSLMNRRQGFYKELEKAMQKEADDKHVKLIITDANMQSQKQLQDVENLLVQKIDALIICPVDSKSAAAPVMAADDRHVPVFTVDISVDGAPVVSHIASDNVAGGTRAAQYMATALHDKGDVIVLDSPVVNSVIDRVKGFETEMKKHPDIHIIQKIDAGAQREPANKAMETMLAAHPKIDGVFAINDETALGALSAIDTSGRKGIVMVGYDATPDAQEKIRAGTALQADVMQFPGKMGSTAIDTALDALGGKKVPSSIPVDVQVVDAATLGSSKPNF